MGNKSGQTAQLPGDLVKVDAGDMCETEGHRHIAATRCVVNEADSMGWEGTCMCDPCYRVYLLDKKENPLVDTCERCNTPNVRLFNKRDWEEGNGGPVYQVCGSCRSSMNPPADDRSDSDDDDSSWEGLDEVFEDDSDDDHSSEEPNNDAILGIEVREWTAADDDVWNDSDGQGE